MNKITEIIPDDIPKWAQDAIDQGNFFKTAIEKVPQWISVEDRLPKESENVLLLLANGEQTTGSLDYDDDGVAWRIGNSALCWDYHFNIGVSVDDVTHWQPIPEDPE